MLQIGEIIIRVPGLNESEARRLAYDVAEQIAAHLPENITGSQEITELNLQLSFRPENGRIEMANAIAEKLLHQLKRIL